MNMTSNEKISKAKNDVTELMKDMSNNTKSILSIYEKMTNEQLAYRDAVKEVVKSYQSAMLDSPMVLNSLLDLAIDIAKKEDVDDSVYKLINKEYGIHLLDTKTYEEFLDVYEVMDSKNFVRQVRELKEAIMDHGLYINQLNSQEDDINRRKYIVERYIELFGYNIFIVNLQLEEKINNLLFTSIEGNDKFIRINSPLYNVLMAICHLNSNWDSLIMHKVIKPEIIANLIHEADFIQDDASKIKYILGIYYTLVSGYSYDAHYKLDTIFVDNMQDLLSFNNINLVIRGIRTLPEKHRLSLIEAIAARDNLTSEIWTSIFSDYPVCKETFRLIKTRMFVCVREVYEKEVLPRLSFRQRWIYNRTLLD